MSEPLGIGVVANYSSVLQKALIFLMRLAWKSRIKLPYLILVGFMVLDIRMTVEVVIDVEVNPTHNGSGTIEDDSDSDDSESEQEPAPEVQGQKLPT